MIGQRTVVWAALSGAATAAILLALFFLIPW